MHHPPTASSHPFLSLSLELKHAIFGSLPDVRSLFSVILTCRSFYHAFLGAPSLLLKIILQRQIAPEVAFDALVAFEASKLGPSQAKWSKRQVKEILALYTGNRSCLWSRQWDLQNALEFSRLRDIVKFFATGFVTTALSRHPTGLLDPPATTLRDVSPAELHRIQRTIYRFDLYCNLFKKKSPTRPTKGAKLVWAVPFTLQEQQAFFFERFSVWENEQLACVHDFLDECLSIRRRPVTRLWKSVG